SLSCVLNQVSPRPWYSRGPLRRTRQHTHALLQPGRAGFAKRRHGSLRLHLAGRMVAGMGSAGESDIRNDLPTVGATKSFGGVEIVWLQRLRNKFGRPLCAVRAI